MTEESASKEPFVSQADRPQVRLTPDTPLSELRVRDLQALLGSAATKDPNFEVGKDSLKDFFDKDFPEVVKDFLMENKPEKLEKSEIKEFKGEKNEKFEKREKFEKPEIKEFKNEKRSRSRSSTQVNSDHQIRASSAWSRPSRSLPGR